MPKKPSRSNQDPAAPRPWWAENTPDEISLPEGFPERPDGKKVDQLRQQLKATRAAHRNPVQRSAMSRYAGRVGKSAKDIGTYTLIPMMMLAGPAVGYILGILAEKKWGGAPWTSVGGMLFGLVAAFRQIFLLLSRKTDTDKRPSGD